MRRIALESVGGDRMSLHVARQHVAEEPQGASGARHDRDVCVVGEDDRHLRASVHRSIDGAHGLAGDFGRREMTGNGVAHPRGELRGHDEPARRQRRVPEFVAEEEPRRIHAGAKLRAPHGGPGEILRVDLSFRRIALGEPEQRRNEGGHERRLDIRFRVPRELPRRQRRIIEERLLGRFPMRRSRHLRLLRKQRSQDEGEQQERDSDRGARLSP
jgi:hypothetical protein